MQVVPLTPSLDIPGSLRRLAAHIEQGKLGNVRFVACVLIGGTQDVAAFSWGQCNELEVSGALARASVIAGCSTGELPVADGESSR